MDLPLSLSSGPLNVSPMDASNLLVKWIIKIEGKMNHQYVLGSKCIPVNVTMIIYSFHDEANTITSLCSLWSSSLYAIIILIFFHDPPLLLGGPFLLLFCPNSQTKLTFSLLFCFILQTFVLFCKSFVLFCFSKF